MAAPMALAAAGTVASVIGGFVKYGAAGAEAKGQEDMFRYKAAVAEANRKNALYAGEQARRAEGEKGAAQRGIAEATFGQSNITGHSHEAVLKSMADLNIRAQDVRTYDAMRRAYGEEAEEGLDYAAARQARLTGEYKQASVLTDTLSSVSDKWLTASKSGMMG
jgi:hypothetical protein